MGPEDRFTAKERTEAVVAAGEEIQKKCREALPRARNLELLILKCHVTVEFAVEAYIRAVSAGNVNDNELRFGFEEKVNIAFMLGLGVKDPLLLLSIRLLNRIRNDMAHRLTLNEKKLDELIRINSDQYNEKHTFTHSERLSGLKSITYATCGMIAGFMEAQVTFEEHVTERALSSGTHLEKT